MGCCERVRRVSEGAGRGVEHPAPGRKTWGKEGGEVGGLQPLRGGWEGRVRLGGARSGTDGDEDRERLCVEGANTRTNNSRWGDPCGDAAKARTMQVGQGSPGSGLGAAALQTQQWNN